MFKCVVLVFLVGAMMNLGLQACCDAAELRAGAGRVEITPPAGGKMAGYSARVGVSKDVYDPLMAKVLVLTDDGDKLAVVTLDLGGFPEESVENVKKQIAESTGIDQVMMVASHTHSGPAADRDFPSEEDPWLAKVEKNIAEQIVAAYNARVPCVVSVGRGAVDWCHNRRYVADDGSVQMMWRNEERRPTSPIDPEVAVIRVDSAAGKPISVLVNYACHSVVLGPDNLHISADWPGVMQRVVEEESGTQCMFLQGAAGDINPYMDKQPQDQDAFGEVEKMGKGVAKEVLRVSKGVRQVADESGDLKVMTEVVPIAPRYDFNEPETRKALEKKYGKALVERYAERFSVSEMKAPLVTAMIGEDLALVGAPGEFFVEFALDLKTRCEIDNTFFVGYCNGSLAYFPTIKAATEGGYGATYATVVEVGAGEKLIDKAIINLYTLSGRLSPIPSF